MEHRGVKGKKKDREKTVSERKGGGGGGGGSNGWVGRATGGRYRERQEAGQRERDRLTEKEAQQREEKRGGGRAAASVSPLLPPGSIAACFLPVKFPSWMDSTVWRKILEWWTSKLNLSHSGLSPVDTRLPLGIEITKPYREGKHSDRPRDH